MSINEYHNDIRRHIESNKYKVGYGGSLFVYQVDEDELNDPSLVSLRAYKTRFHADVVRIACRVSFVHENLPNALILLPSLKNIVQMQKKYGITNA